MSILAQKLGCSKTTMYNRLKAVRKEQKRQKVQIVKGDQ